MENLIDRLASAKKSFEVAGGNARDGEYRLFVPEGRYEELRREVEEGNDEAAKEAFKMFGPIPA